MKTFLSTTQVRSLLPDLDQDLDQDLLETIGDVPTEVAKAALRRSIWKKLLPLKQGRRLPPGVENISASTRREAAYSEFNRCNDRCRDNNELWNNALGGPKSTNVSPAMHSFYQVLLGEARNALTDWLHVVDNAVCSGEWIAEGYPGPGSVTDVADCDALAKLLERDRFRTDNPNLVVLWARYMSRLITWDSEEESFDDDGSYRCFIDITHNDEISTRCTNVPKSVNTDRAIVVTDTVQAVLSRGLGVCIEHALDRLGFSISTQPDRQRLLAKLGSIDITAESPATIDLKSSSDLLYSSLVDWMMIDLPHLRRAANVCRNAKINVGKVPTVLHMFATMGNGMTFALQTIIYLSFIEALYRLDGKDRRSLD